jgi:hypothetical protein
MLQLTYELCVLYVHVTDKENLYYIKYISGPQSSGKLGSSTCHAKLCPALQRTKLIKTIFKKRGSCLHITECKNFNDLEKIVFFILSDTPRYGRSGRHSYHWPIKG